MTSAAALLAACSGFPIASVKVDPRSPIAREVAETARDDRVYPQFSDIPPAPKDVRPARVYGERAQQVESAKAELDAATAPNTWTLSNTQGFSNQVRKQAGPDYDEATSRATEAFANTIRKRATQPPPAQP